MSKFSILPVILSGGIGSRLWPLSRELFPKQLLSLLGQRSMLQETLLRIRAEQKELLDPIIIAAEEQRFIIEAQLRELNLDGQIRVVLEPTGRNTAPAITVAALLAKQWYPGQNITLLILPADHIITKPENFFNVMQEAFKWIEKQGIITFGVSPHYPETGYGYIKKGNPIDQVGLIYEVEHFKEKPDRQTAQQYVASKKYYWNSGMFMMNSDVLLNEMKCFAPEIVDCCQEAVKSSSETGRSLHLGKKAFAACHAESIDYVLMEKLSHSAVIELECGWSDVGSWNALYGVESKDENDNVIYGNAVCHATKGCYIRANNRLITTYGLRDCVVIETSDAILVADRFQTQNVKEIVAELKQHAQQEETTISHPRVIRPWGYYEILNEGPGFKVKRIFIKPGAALSLQMHEHRSEHWVVVSGKATVLRGEETYVLTNNQSIDIPSKTKHRLANDEINNLEIIEIQSGSYLGEDDIVRFVDDYNRIEQG